jgi:small basic protein
MPKDRNATILRQSPEPPAYLAEKVLCSIRKEESKRIRRQIAVSGMLLVVSLGSAVASMMSLGGELSRSGFLSFVSLFSSDFSSVTANFREVFFSLIESFPAVSAALCIASVAFVLWFGVRLVNEAGTIRRNRFAMRQLFIQ